MHSCYGKVHLAHAVVFYPAAARHLVIKLTNVLGEGRRVGHPIKMTQTSEWYHLFPLTHY